VITLRLIQMIAFPIELVGYILFVSKAMLFRRRAGVSMTALAPLYMRHMLGTKLDEPGVRLMALPNVSRADIRLFTAPTVLASQLTGYVPGVKKLCKND